MTWGYLSHLKVKQRCIWFVWNLTTQFVFGSNFSANYYYYIMFIKQSIAIEIDIFRQKKKKKTVTEFLLFILMLELKLWRKIVRKQHRRVV